MSSLASPKVRQGSKDKKQLKPLSTLAKIDLAYRFHAGFKYYGTHGDIRVSFSGQILPVFKLSSGVFGYEQFGADVSQLAGQTGELRFTSNVYGSLDFIQFSSQAIPEPSVPVLAAIGAGLLGWHVSKRKRD